MGVSSNEFTMKTLEQQQQQQQQQISHQQMMQEQVQNTMKFRPARRMSMPTMGCTNEFPMQQQQQNSSPRFSTLEYPLNMPVQSKSTNKTLYRCHHVSAQPEQKSCEAGYQSSDNTVESSIDEETAELLINMPIMDMDGNDDKQQNKNKTHFIDEDGLLLAACDSVVGIDHNDQSDIIIAAD